MDGLMRKYRVFSIFCCCLFLLVYVSVAFADKSGTVKTPKGTKVSVTIVTADYSKNEIKALDAQIKKTYPKATLIESSTKKYNCHSYAWYSQSSSNDVWMNEPKAYMTDGSYGGYCSASPPKNDKVYYPAGHSAISLGGKMLQSKWGRGPLMKHALDYGPDEYKMSCYYGFTRLK